MSSPLRLALQLALFVPALMVIPFAAPRLLGVRRSWWAGTASAAISMFVATSVALVLADGDVRAPGFFRNSLALAFALTMVTAVGADLLARPGSLRRPAVAAGGGDLPGVPHPLAALRDAVDEARPTREVAGIPARN